MYKFDLRVSFVYEFNEMGEWQGEWCDIAIANLFSISFRRSFHLHHSYALMLIT